MPHTTPLGLTYDSGDFARNLDDALAAADAAGFPGAARRGAEPGPLSRARARGLYRAIRLPARRIRRSALRPVRHADAPDGHAILGPGASDRLCPARRREARPAARKDPRAAGRHRCDRVRPRHRRLALAAGRRRGAGPCRRQADRQGQEDRRAHVRSRRGRYRLRGRRLHDCRHRPQCHASRRSRAPPSTPANCRPVSNPVSPRAAISRRRRRLSRTAVMSARSRSTPRPGRSRSCAIWWSTISAPSSTRCCWRARCMAGSRRGSGRRCSNARSTTRRAVSS